MGHIAFALALAIRAVEANDYRAALKVSARVKFTAAPRIGIAYASKRDQNRKWRFTFKKEGEVG